MINKGLSPFLAKKRGTVPLLIVILLVAFLLRLAYLHHFKDTAFFNPALMDKHDQKTFHFWAREIQVHPWSGNGAVFYMAPLYPYFLAGLYAVSAESVLAVLLVQLLMDCMLCYFLYLLGRYLMDERVGLTAAFFGCFYLTFIVYAGTILSDSLILFLYTSFILCVYFSLQKPNFMRWMLTGVVLGLSALAKPTIGIFLPFLLLGLFLYPTRNLISFGKTKSLVIPAVPPSVIPADSKRESREKRAPVPFFAQVLLCFLIVWGISGLVVLPVTIRNWWVGRQFVPICSNGPINWAIGNSSDSLGLFCYPKGSLLSPLSSAFWELQLRKTIFFFTSYEWPQNLNVYLMANLVPSLKLAFFRFGLVVPLGMAGLAVLCKDWKRNFLFISFALSNILWVVLFFITDRYRLPAVACLMVSAGYFLVWTIDCLKRKLLAGVLVSWVLVGLFAYFFNTVPGPLIPDTYVKIFSGLSKKNIVYDLGTGNLAKSYKEAAAFVRLMPDNPDAHFLLACALNATGRKSEAVFALHKVLELNPDYEPARRFLRDLTSPP